MSRSTLRAFLTVAAIAALSACGKPIESKEELLAPVGGASVPATVARGGSFALLASAANTPDQLPQPSITLKGTHGGKATLSVNPVGIAVGLVGQGLLFDIEYDDYSVDGVNWLHGKVSVLANFDYVAVEGEAPELNFELGFVGTLEISGAVRDEVRLNLKIRTNLQELADRIDRTQFRFNGKVTASEATFEFADEDVIIDWAALAAQAD